MLTKKKTNFLNHLLDIPPLRTLQIDVSPLPNETNTRIGNFRILRKRLMSKDCQNQGYVIDGYPKTLSQAKDVFGLSGDDEEDERNDDDIEEASTTDGYRKIMPELVVVLEADDEFLIERVIRLPEKEIQQTHYNEEGMLRRLREYR